LNPFGALDQSGVQAEWLLSKKPSLIGEGRQAGELFLLLKAVLAQTLRE